MFRYNVGCNLAAYDNDGSLSYLGDGETSKFTFSCEGAAGVKAVFKKNGVTKAEWALQVVVPILSTDRTDRISGNADIEMSKRPTRAPTN